MLKTGEPGSQKAHTIRFDGKAIVAGNDSIKVRLPVNTAGQNGENGSTLQDFFCINSCGSIVVVLPDVLSRPCLPASLIACLHVCMSTPQVSSLQEAPSDSGGKVVLRSSKTSFVIEKPTAEAREMVAAVTEAWQAPAVAQQTTKRKKKKSAPLAFHPSNTLHQGSRPPAARSNGGGGGGGGKRAKKMVAAAAASTPVASAGRSGLNRGAVTSGQLTRSPYFHRKEEEEEEVCVGA